MTDLTTTKTTLLAGRETVINDLRAIATLNEETGDWEASPVTELSEADSNNEADGVEDWNERHATVTQLETLYRGYNRALDKIERGTYGVCEVCGEEISPARLLVLPTARTCVNHIDDERTLSL